MVAPAKILGFGQVLWDYTVETDFSFLEKRGFTLGGHHLVDKTTLQKLLRTLEEEGHTVMKNPGGSTANVMSNLAKLGTKSAFCGKHGKDQDGFEYMKILQREGVITYELLDEKEATGRLLCIITPDKERTFVVHWGAAEQMPATRIEKSLIQSAELCHVEGYLIINSAEVLKKIFENAYCLTYDLAAHTVVNRTRPVLQELMKQHPPFILFANLFEGKTFTQKNSPKEISDEMLKFAEIAVLTLGPKGVIIKTREGEEHFEKALPTPVVDTTGAGDAFSAGFLHEFLKTMDIKKAARLGVKTASATIRRMGARSFHPQQLKELC